MIPEPSKATRPVLVVGHVRPDADSAVSAAVYAQLLNQLHGPGSHLGVVLGELTPQTSWLFQLAGLPAPAYLPDLRLRVADVMCRETQAISETASLGEALRALVEHKASVVPVVDSSNRLLGLVSDRLPSCNYFHNFNTEDFLGVLLELADLERALGLVRWQAPTRPARGRIQLDPGALHPGDLLLTGDTPAAMAIARRHRVAAVIACVPRLTHEWKLALKQYPYVGLFQFRGSLMALASQLAMAIPARKVMTQEFPRLSAEQPLEEVRQLVAETPYGLPVVSPDGKLEGVLSRASLLNSPRQRLILVDHFERHQAGEGIGRADILEIVDHHRVGTIETPVPIRVDCRPVGSTATIITSKFNEQGLQPDRRQAVLLLGALLADTLLLTSPTTTDTDRAHARQLAKRARLNLQEFGRDLLARNDQTACLPAAELLEMDLKEFSAGKLRFAVAQVETVDRTRLPKAKLAEFSRAMVARRLQGGWEFLALMITDSLRGDSLVLVEDAHPRRRQSLLGANPSVWPGCVSRKKQFVPAILERLQTDSES